MASASLAVLFLLFGLLGFLVSSLVAGRRPFIRALAGTADRA